MKHRGTRVYLTRDELTRFLRAAKDHGPREHAMFLFALAHGARTQEISNLVTSDLLADRVFINRVKNSEKSLQNFLVSDNPLFDEKYAFENWLSQRPNNDTKVFGISRIQIFRLFQKIATSAGIPLAKRHPHVLKHTLAMLLLEDNQSAFVIQKALGHKSISSTLAYLHPTDAQASTAIQKALGDRK